jgi:hypothetical protein
MKAVPGHAASRRSSSSGRRRLVVVETGAALSCRDDAGEFDETTAITQLSGEGAEELAERALHRVTVAGRSGHVFDSALLLVSEAGSSSARRRVALGLATQSAASQRLTELTLLAPAAASEELRADLLRLADELLSGAEPALQVRLRFADERQPPTRSGTFWSIPEPDSDETGSD